MLQAKALSEGRRAYFKADTASPVFPDLRALFEKTAGLVPILQQELASLGERIQLAFLYGSIARSQETSESDVDLMIVGTTGLSDLLPSLRPCGASTEPAGEPHRVLAKGVSTEGKAPRSFPERGARGAKGVCEGRRA